MSDTSAAIPLTVPIERDTSRYGRLYRNAIVLMACGVAGMMTWLGVQIALAAPTQLWTGVIIAAAPWAAPALCYRLIGRGPADTLQIDTWGVRFTRERAPHEFAWRDLARARRIMISRGSRGSQPVYAMQLQRKGAIYGPDDLFDYLQPGQFGLSEGDFASVIAAGIEKWGGGLPAD